MLSATLVLQAACALTPPAGVLVSGPSGGYAFGIAASPRAVVVTWLEERAAAPRCDSPEVHGMAASLDATTLSPLGPTREVNSVQACTSARLNGLAPLAEPDGTIAVASCDFHAPADNLRCAMTALLGPSNVSPDFTLHPGAMGPVGNRLAAAWVGSTGLLLLPRADTLYLLSARGSRREFIGNGPVPPESANLPTDVPVLIAAEPDRALALWRREHALWARSVDTNAQPHGPAVVLSPPRAQVGAPAALWEADHAARIVYAQRARDRDPWQLQWQRWVPGTPPRPVALLTGAEPAMAPAVAQTTDPHCQLLTFTEGRGHATVVRAARVCNDALVTASLTTLSAAGVEAGDSELASNETSVYVAWQTLPAHAPAELRVARLECR